MHSIQQLNNSILHFIAVHGYSGLLIFFIFEEGGVPMPIPGDFALIYAGYLISRGFLNFYTVLLSALFGVMIGSTILFFIFDKGGRVFAYAYGKYILLPKRRINKLENFFEKYGKKAVFIGRFIPGFRVYISAISGLAGTLSYRYFLAQVIAAAIIWEAAFIGVGIYLGDKYVNLVSKLEGSGYILFIIFIGIIGLELIRNRKKE